jgi:nitrite reductase/ring-hydroxylating ferredoxin subunit
VNDAPNAQEELMDGWVEVGSLAGLTERGQRFVIDEQPVLVVRVADLVLAIGNQCSHQGAGLDRGVVKIAGSVRTVTCPDPRERVQAG